MMTGSDNNDEKAISLDELKLILDQRRFAISGLMVLGFIALMFTFLSLTIAFTWLSALSYHFHIAYMLFVLSALLAIDVVGIALMYDVFYYSDYFFKVTAQWDDKHKTSLKHLLDPQQISVVLTCSMLVASSVIHVISLIWILLHI